MNPLRLNEQRRGIHGRPALTFCCWVPAPSWTLNSFWHVHALDDSATFIVPFLAWPTRMPPVKDLLMRKRFSNHFLADLRSCGSHLEGFLLKLQLGDAGMRWGRGKLLVFKLSLHTGQASRQWTRLWLIHHLRTEDRSHDICQHKTSDLS